MQCSIMLPVTGACCQQNNKWTWSWWRSRPCKEIKGESHIRMHHHTQSQLQLVLTLQRSYALYHYHGDNEIQYLRHFCLAWLYVEKPLLMRCRVIGHLLQHWAALVHWSGMELSHRRTAGSSQPTTDKVHDKVLFRSRFHLKFGLIIASVLQNSVKHVRQLQ